MNWPTKSYYSQYWNCVSLVFVQKGHLKKFFFTGNFDALCDFVTKSSDVLVKNVGMLDDVLATLDLQEHSLGVLAIL